MSAPRRMRHALWLVAVCAAAPPALAKTINRIAAVVNDEVITEADVDAYLGTLQEEDRMPPGGPESGGMRQAVLRRLIEQRVILHEARREGLVIDADELAKRLDDIRQRFESEEAFRQSLEEAQLPLERLKEQIRDQAMVERLIDAKVRATITVSPQEVAKELGDHPELARPGERVRASHILVRVSEARPVEKARALIEDLQRRLSQGAGFAELARRHSEDPHAPDGGAMGWVAREELLPELDEPLFRLKEGEVSEPIQTRLGFHLVQVHERSTASNLSLMEANQAVSQQLYQRKFREAFTRWLNGLLQRAYIETIPPAESPG